MPRIPNRRDDDREPIAPAPIAEAPPAPATPPPPTAASQPMAAPVGDPSLPASAADEAVAGAADLAGAGDAGATPPASAPLPPIIPTEAHEAEADLLLADAEDPPRAAPARGWRTDAQRVYRMVSDELLLATGGKRLPTIEEIDRAIEGAVARTTAQHREPEAGPPPAAPLSAPDIEAATNRLAAEALDPAWADDPEAVARSRRWVRHMLDSGASEDEVQGMLAETGTRDWLNRYAAKLGDGWDDEGPEAPSAKLIPAGWQPAPSGAAPAPNPLPISASSQPASGAALPPLSDIATIQTIMSDPIQRSRYVELVNGTPALINNILIDEVVYARVNDVLLDQLNILPPAQSGKQASGKKGGSNGAVAGASNFSGLSIMTVPDQKALNNLEVLMMKNFKNKMQSKPMHFAMPPLNADQSLRSFSHEIATITLAAKVNALFVGERYVGIARRASDGKLFITSVATGAEQGGSASHMTGFSRGPQLPAGYKIVALLHTHATGHLLKNPDSGKMTDKIDPFPGPGDPTSVWYDGIPAYVASYSGNWKKPFDPTKVVLYEVNREGCPKKDNPRAIKYKTIVNDIDSAGNATPSKGADKFVKIWKFNNWDVKVTKP
ncbi:hypothetical protein [Sphingomonas sanxanigenens]|uniref:hypothetical protein n=1 Tax=Sphingomonas sanxanigenens TaxID=397260 RepID=UPI0004B6AB75|nr:hypothetical protein [Sphingomonas sanxanigenens]